MQTDEQLRAETELGDWAVYFYSTRVEETRIAMVDAEHRWRTYYGCDLDKSRSLYDTYQKALENWRDARHQLYKAHVERETINE